MKDFVKRMLMDEGTPSSSRVLMVGTTICACVWITYMLIKTHQWPDAGTLSGLAAFCTSSYLVNRTTTAYQKSKDTG